MSEIAIVAGLAALVAFGWFIGAMLEAGYYFRRMAGDFNSCRAIYAAWCAERDAETDATMRRGFRAAEKRGWIKPELRIVKNDPKDAA